MKAWRSDSFAYIHLRVGRDIKNAPLDPARFTLLADAAGKTERVRIKRGTRFAVGDALGTVNRMFHVHLVHRTPNGEANPLALPFPGLEDNVIPRIDSIALHDRAEVRLTAKEGKRLLVPRTGGPLAIVVDAYDQTDGNAARRKLGLYKVGYQILAADGTPLVKLRAAAREHRIQPAAAGPRKRAGGLRQRQRHHRLRQQDHALPVRGDQQRARWRGGAGQLGPGPARARRLHHPDHGQRLRLSNVALAGRDLAIAVR
ncbi:hypothetical protein LP420_09740 [Massilia sp. B-10]|nr:hypothetical protein LP420_09740 [Massilia sp. B-10]